MQTLYYSENDPLIVKCSQWLKWRRTDLIYRRTVESVAVFCFAQNPQHLQRSSFVLLSLNNDRIHNSKKYSSSLPCHGLWDVQTSIWAFWRVQERETWYADNIRAESRHYKILQIQASLSFEVLPKKVLLYTLKYLRTWHFTFGNYAKITWQSRWGNLISFVVLGWYHLTVTTSSKIRNICFNVLWKHHNSRYSSINL